MTKTELKPGSIVNVAGIDFIVLDTLIGNHYFFTNYVLCITKKILFKENFDDNSNNYCVSKIRKRLNNEFLSKLANAVGEENILNSEISLMSSKGQIDYGTVPDKVGLLTESMYNKYKDTINKRPVKWWWWLATPRETSGRIVRGLNGAGMICNYDCDNINSGVRPFVYFDPKIFNL